MHRRKINPNTGTSNANPTNRRRGHIIKKKGERGQIAMKKMEKPPLPKKAKHEAWRKGDSPKNFNIDARRIERIEAETVIAQNGITPKAKEKDARTFDPSIRELREGKYRIMGRKKSSSPRPMPVAKIAEGRLRHLLQMDDEGKFEGIEDRSLEMQVGNEWVVMTHPEYFAKAKEGLSVPA